MRRIRERTKHAGDLDPGCLDGCAAVDGLEVLAIVVIVVIVAVVAVFFVVPLLVAVLDVLVLLTLAALALVFRVVFRRPWVVEAHRRDVDDVVLHRWAVVGWRASGERVAEVAQRLSAGLGPPPEA